MSESVWDVRERRVEDEVMDDPALDAARHAHALSDLARINSWAAAHWILWRPIREFARSVRRPIRVLDIATGSADFPVRFWQRARATGLQMQIDACDRSEEALKNARQRVSRAGAQVQLFRLDVLTDPIPPGYDVLTSSQFLHQLPDDQAVPFLRKLADSTQALVLIHDLTRSRAALVLTWVATRVLTRSDVVHTDGMLSVRAAYTVAEARQLAARAGLGGATVQRRWPLRFLLRWQRFDR